MTIDTAEIRRWVEDRKTIYKDETNQQLCSDLLDLLSDYEDTVIREMEKEFLPPLTPAQVILDGIRKVL